MSLIRYSYAPLPCKEIEEKPHPWAKTNKDVFAHRIKHAQKSITNPNYSVKEEKQPASNRIQFTVIGDRVSKEFTYCNNLVKGLYKYRWKNFAVPIIKGCSTIEWPEVLHNLKDRFSGLANCLLSSVAVLLNDRIIGGEKELQHLIETTFYYHLCLDYYNEGVAEFARFIRSTSRPFAYMHVSIDDKHIGTLIYMLYADIVPYTCENFLRLCKERRGGYGGTPVHRIVKDGWIQCGGFGLKSTPLSCENFIIPLDKRGVLAMANDGRDDDCSTQFFVLLQPAPWMNHKYVAFGQLIEGAATLEKIESVSTWYESPNSKIILYRCGIFNMECHDIIINRGANEYIDAHIEDLNILAELLWEHILEKTFLQAQLRELERMRALEGEGADASTEDGEPPKRLEEDADENQEFDVEEIEFKAEEEEDAYKHQSLQTYSLVVKPQKPYYIPLTDVPYTGDVESDFDLKRFLKGDYCLESDLSKTKGEVAVLPPRFWDECNSTSSSSQSEDISMNSEEREEIESYIKENVDRVSFSGEVVKKIIKRKKSTEKSNLEPIYTDEKIRKIRLASEEHNYRQKHNIKVSLSAPGAYEPERKHRIKRQQTGFVHSQDLEKVFHTLDDDDDDNDEVDVGSTGKALSITFGQLNSNAGAARPALRRPTGFFNQPARFNKGDEDEHVRPSKPKESVLLRLYDEVNVDNEQGPTLKNYIPTANNQHKNLLVTTQYTPLFQAKDSMEKTRIPRNQYKRNSSSTTSSFEHVLNLQHASKISRKISTDYVKIIDSMEKNRLCSIRTVEYAKRRPTISVSDYQIQNLKYQEQLKRKASLGSW